MNIVRLFAVFGLGPILALTITGSPLVAQDQGPPFEVVAEAGVPAAIVRDARSGMEAALVRLASHYGTPYDAGPITGYVFNTAASRLEGVLKILTLPEERARGLLGMSSASNQKGVIATVHPASRTIWLRLDEPNFQTNPGMSVGKIMAHEVFHLFQASRQGYQDPVWIIEGTAEYFGFELGVIAGFFTRSALKQYCVGSISRFYPSLPRLEAMETPQGWSSTNQEFRGGTWCLFHSYFSFLEEKQPRALGRYYDLRRSGTDWATAFREAFGRQPSLVDAEFQQFLRNYIGR